MVFIVSDQRIATENFEKGKIYKVVFLDESIFYGVCLGIGSNFVMLSGNISGYLFPLTMETASQVESIDLFDPTPPEPPVPWTNLLQYQTGAPLFTFNTTEDQLFSWYITGAGVGDKTANLSETIKGGLSATDGSDVAYNSTNSQIRTQYIPCEPNTTYTVSATKYISNNFVCFYDNSKTYLSRTSGTPVSDARSFTTPANAVYFRAVYTHVFDGQIYPYDDGVKIMLNTGSTVLPYEPYGIKIPILCNDHLTNIYLDAPLEEDEILYSTDIDTNIITDIGNNILSVETTQQPSEMQIVYKIADR